MNQNALLVVVAESNDDERQRLGEFLTAAGDISVVPYATGEKAVKAAASGKPACIVAANDLPDLDGLAILDKLANDSGAVTIPVIVILDKDKRMTVTKLQSSGAAITLVRGTLTAETLERSVRDAVRMKHLENRLQEQRNIFLTMLSGSPGLVMMKNLQHQYQAVNPAFCTFVGKNAQHVVGKADDAVFPADEAAATAADEDKVIQADAPDTVEQELSGAKGKRWFRMTRSPIKDSDGKTVGLLCSAVDITEAKQLESQVGQLSESEKEAKQALESALDDAQAKMADLEQQAAAANQRADEAEGRIANELNAAQEQLTAAQAQVTELETALGAKDAEIQAAAQKAADAEAQVAALQTAADLAGQRFTHFADIAACALCEIGNDTKLGFLNPRGLTLFGLAEGDVQNGVTLSELFVNDERARVAEAIKQSMQGTNFGPTTFRMLHKDGHELHVDVTGSPVAADGKVTGMRFAMLDVSAQQGAEANAKAIQTLAAGAKSAAGAVRELSAALEHIAANTGATTASDDALASVGQLAAAAEHVENTMRPLTGKQ